MINAWVQTLKVGTKAVYPSKDVCLKLDKAKMLAGAVVSLRMTHAASVLGANVAIP